MQISQNLVVSDRNWPETTRFFISYVTNPFFILLVCSSFLELAHLRLKELFSGIALPQPGDSIADLLLFEFQRALNHKANCLVSLNLTKSSVREEVIADDVTGISTREEKSGSRYFFYLSLSLDRNHRLNLLHHISGHWKYSVDSGRINKLLTLS